jgi:hypothetical protein
MARHLSDVTDAEFAQLMAALIAWLKATNVAGSVAQDYSLYRVLDAERARARQKAGLDVSTEFSELPWTCPDCDLTYDEAWPTLRWPCCRQAWDERRIALVMDGLT